MSHWRAQLYSENEEETVNTVKRYSKAAHPRKKLRLKGGRAKDDLKVVNNK
jgi:hypothetical protein